MVGDTIYALSSGTLPSGVAVIRLSGPQARFALETICRTVPEARYATLRTLRARAGDLDRGLVFYFTGPASFTGEDCAEFHIHGGKAVVAALLRELASLPGLRSAEPGEFTRRAFLNGKLDITATEALADLINAETEAQRRLALLNAGGAQKKLYESWRSRLLHARAMIEAELDFADEADVPGSVSSQVWRDVECLQQEIRNHIAGFSRAEIIREGFQVVILGAPNSGKSTLLNALAQREAAIVADEPGTTRDLIEVPLELAGAKVVVTDTAGIREDPGKVEAIGIERALNRAKSADLILYLEDRNNPHPLNIDPSWPVLTVGAKADLPTCNQHIYDVEISAVSGAGMDILVSRIADIARAATAGPDLMPSRLRHVQYLGFCDKHLGNALENSIAALEIRAEDLRHAADALGRITGVVGVEELLGAIFAEFCIGK